MAEAVDGSDTCSEGGPWDSGFSGFPQPLQRNSGTVSQIRSRQIPSRSTVIHH
jgi:hypothetical protein